MLEIVLAGLLGAVLGYGFCAYRRFKRLEAEHMQRGCDAWTERAESAVQPVCLHVGDPISGTRIRASRD